MLAFASDMAILSWNKWTPNILSDNYDDNDEDLKDNGRNGNGNGIMIMITILMMTVIFK